MKIQVLAHVTALERTEWLKEPDKLDVTIKFTAFHQAIEPETFARLFRILDASNPIPLVIELPE